MKTIEELKEHFPNIEFSDKYMEILKYIRENNDAKLSIQGNAGSGKSTLLKIINYMFSDDVENKKWLNYFKDTNTLLVNSMHDNLKIIVVNKVKEILKDKIEKARAKGIRKKVLRAMVIGIPNVGKSTFINNIVKKKVAKTENRPGVTKSLTWININEDLMLLDTPGV